MAVLRIASVHKVATKCGIALCGRHLGWTWDGHLQTCVLVSLFQRWSSLISRMFDSCVCDHKLPDNVHLTYIYIYYIYTIFVTCNMFRIFCRRSFCSVGRSCTIPAVGCQGDVKSFTDEEPYEDRLIEFHGCQI